MDYDEIIKKFKAKVKTKINVIQLEKKKREIERLQAEVEKGE